VESKYCCIILGEMKSAVKCSMLRRPELILGYEKEPVPGIAACSACGQLMPDPLQSRLESRQRFAWYKSQFETHCLRCHTPFKPGATPCAPSRPSTVGLMA